MSAIIDISGSLSTPNPAGILHNERGPAVIYVDGIRTCFYESGLVITENYRLTNFQVEHVEWWLNGYRLSEQEFIKSKFNNLLK